MQNGTNNLFQLVSSDLYKKSTKEIQKFCCFFSTCKIKEKIKDYFFFSFIYVIILVAELKPELGPRLVPVSMIDWICAILLE